MAQRGAHVILRCYAVVAKADGVCMFFRNILFNQKFDGQNCNHLSVTGLHYSGFFTMEARSAAGAL